MDIRREEDTNRTVVVVSSAALMDCTQGQHKANATNMVASDSVPVGAVSEPWHFWNELSLTQPSFSQRK